MKVRFKKLTKTAKEPTKAHPTDAGFDLYADSRECDNLGSIVYGTGLALEIPNGYMGLVFPRSSVSKKDLLLSNSVGLIDSGYRGEVFVKFKPSSRAYKSGIMQSPSFPSTYEIGERIAQLVIVPYPEIEFEQSRTLEASERGTGGFGSTGK